MAIGAVIALISLAYGIQYVANRTMLFKTIPGIIPSPTRTAVPTPTATLSPTATLDPTRTARPTRTPIPRIDVAPGQLVYVKHESTSRGQGLPDTYQYYLFRFEPAPPGSPLREYIRQVQRLAVPAMPESEFEKNMAGFWASNRALSNGHGYEEDFAVGPVITGGAMARATGNVMYKAGKAFVEVYAIDPQHLPPVPATIGGLDWTLHFRPTIVTPFTRPDGRWKINPFPQFDGWGIAPLLGRDGRQWINAAILVPIAEPVGPFDYPPIATWPTASPP
ncbi:MAG: hypothetical protein ACK2T0_00175 [Anaerolineales bacterium]